MIKSGLVILLSILIPFFAWKRNLVLSQMVRTVEMRNRGLSAMKERLDRYRSELKPIRLIHPQDRAGLARTLFRQVRRFRLHLEMVRIGPEDQVRISLSGHFNQIGQFLSSLEREFPRLEIKGFEIRAEEGRTILSLTARYHY